MEMSLFDKLPGEIISEFLLYVGLDDAKSFLKTYDCHPSVGKIIEKREKYEPRIFIQKGRMYVYYGDESPFNLLIGSGMKEFIRRSKNSSRVWLSDNKYEARIELPVEILGKTYEDGAEINPCWCVEPYPRQTTVYCIDNTLYVVDQYLTISVSMRLKRPNKYERRICKEAFNDLPTKPISFGPFTVIGNHDITTLRIEDKMELKISTNDFKQILLKIE